MQTNPTNSRSEVEEGESARNPEVDSLIADELSDAIRALDAAYDIAVEAWGEDDERSRSINSAWSETETVFRQFHKE